MKTQATILFLSAGLFFTLFHPGHPLTVDSAATLQTVRALARGHFDIPEMMVTRPGRGGLHYSYYGPLLPILSLPAYRIGACFDDPPPAPGSPDVGWGDWLALNSNAWISAGILVVLFYVGLHFGAPWRASYALAVGCGLGTMILPYARDYFSQPLCAFLLAASGLGMLRHRREGSRLPLWLASLAIALLPWARMDMGVFFGVFILWLLAPPVGQGDSVEPTRKDRLAHLLPLVPLLVSVMGLVLFDRLRWGRWGGAPYGDHAFDTPLADSIPRFLFSPELSVFLHNPVLLASLFFLIAGWRDLRRFAIPVLLADLVYLAIVGMFRDYHGGVCPGPRYLLSLVPINLFPLFHGLSQSGFRRKSIVVPIVLAIVLGLLVNGYEALVDYTSSPPAWDYWKAFLF